MATKLFVGSLSYATNDDQLRALFAEVGTVDTAKVIMNRDTNQSKGFGFVEMPNDEEAQTAIKNLNGKEVDGRRLIVNVARPMTDSGGSRPSFSRGRNY
jgi:cold-inducible RNA-binding protein